MKLNNLRDAYSSLCENVEASLNALDTSLNNLHL